jgi:hypothetical protein
LGRDRGQEALALLRLRAVACVDADVCFVAIGVGGACDEELPVGAPDAVTPRIRGSGRVASSLASSYV